MARITSLSILTTADGKDYLAEVYGPVIENIATKSISSIFKNQELSGDPAGGTVEAKRFANAQVDEYGTARAAGKGNNIKAKPVIIALNKDKEITEEIEEKDVRLYGVDSVIERRSKNHEVTMRKHLEKEFFNVASGSGQVFTTTETDTAKKVEALIVKIEETNNEFVDGVDRSVIGVVVDAKTYSNLRTEIDTYQNANISTADAEFGLFHGCLVVKSTDLPEGVEMVGMVFGSVAQPVMVDLLVPEKIQASKAYIYGLFFDYGTKEVSPDLIQVLTKGTLTVTSAAGTVSGDTKITVKEAQLAGTKYFVKSASSLTAPAVGSELTGYTEWDGVADITATTGHKLAVAEVNADGVVIRAGSATVVAASN